MKVSIIMSVFNAEKYIDESVQSIIGQSFTDFEFIVVNDNSTDRTYEILQKYALQDKRIVLHNNAVNMGLTYNLNVAAKNAKGEYIARMDADDISLPNRISTQVRYLDQHKEIDIVGSFAQDVDEYGVIGNIRKVPVQHLDIFKTICIVNPLIHPSVMYRSEFFRNIGGYKNDYRVVQDYDLWFRALSEGYQIFNIPEILLYYRVNANYHKRKSFNYRITDIKIRHNGYNLLKIPFYKRYGIFVPIILSIIPKGLSAKMYITLKRLDPRN